MMARDAAELGLVDRIFSWCTATPDTKIKG